MSYTLFADLILILHVGFVLFVVGGLLLIVLGNLCHWRWVNRWWFRLAHLGAIAVVVAESWAGWVCPLTTFEQWLRARAGDTSYSGGFIEHWLQQLLYYDAPTWVFLLIYSLFGLLVLASWWLFPPTPRTGKK
jgi:polyferredoxin